MTVICTIDPAEAVGTLLDRLDAGSSRLLVGVSGGADSMALMHATWRHAAERLEVVHVHHGLRAAADSDADFVAAAAAALALPFHRVDAPAAAGEARTETAARARRMAAFTATASRRGIRYVLLAHHLDDELETAVLQRERGHTGPRARAGIPTLRSLAPLQGDGSPFLLRPFCTDAAALTREDLRRYARRHGLRHVEDETNADVRIARNRVRLERQGSGELDPWREERRRARAEVIRQVQGARRRLERHLRPEGLGSFLDSAALQGDDEELAELLRLLGGCLAAPRRMDPRATLLRQLRDPHRSGQLAMPASPRPVLGRVSRAGIHLPDEALAAGPESERLERAMLRTSLYL